MAFHVAVEKPPACPADTAARRIPRGRQLRRSPSPWIATTRVESESFRQCPQVSSSPHRNERAAGEVQSKLTAAVRRRCDSLACTPDSRICTSGNTEAAGPAMESLGPRPGSRVASAYCRHTTVLRLKRPQTAGAPPAGPIRNAPAGSTCACRPAAHRRLCVGIANNRQLQQHVRCQLRCGNQRVRGLAGRHAYSLGRGVGGRRMAGGGWREEDGGRESLQASRSQVGFRSCRLEQCVEIYQSLSRVGQHAAIGTATEAVLTTRRKGPPGTM